MNLVWLIPAVLAPGAAMTARTLYRQHQTASADARRDRVQQQRAQRLAQWTRDQRRKRQ